MKKIALFLFVLSLQTSYASLVWDINEGIDLYNKKNYKDALNYFKSYEKANPNDENGSWWIGKTYSTLEDNKNSSKYFQLAYQKARVEKNIDKVVFGHPEQNNNIDDYFDMAAMYYNDGEYKEALNYADMMLKINPNIAGAYFIKAKIANIYGDSDKAKSYLNKAIILNSSILNTNLAKKLQIDKIPELTKEDYLEYAYKAYFEGNLTSTIEYCKKYLDNNSNSVDVALLLIDCYIKNNEINNAKEILKTLLLENKNNISLLIKQAEIEKLENNKNYSDTLLKVYSINPNNKIVLLNLSNYYLQQEDYEASKKYFEKLLSIDDSLYEAYFGYIYSLINLGKSDDAISLIKKATTLNKNTSEIEFLLAKLCEAQGNYQEALDYMQSALQKEENSLYKFNLAKYNYILKKNSVSLTLIDDLDKDYPENIQYSILNYFALEKFDVAKEELNGINSINKNSIMYKYYWYKIYKEENNQKEANSYLNKINRFRPSSVEEFSDYTKVKFLISNSIDEADKILSQGMKKYYDKKSELIKLYFTKFELYALIGDFSKINEINKEIKTIFN